MSSPEKPEALPPPPVMDAETREVGQFILRTRMMVKAGISFEDPRMLPAVNQLGIWPQLVFELQVGADSKPDSEVRIQEVDHVVDFCLALVDVPEGEELAKRAGALVTWCQQLLGEDWAVHIQNRKKKGGKYKMLYRGSRLVPAEARTPTLLGAPFPEAVTKFRRFSQEKKKFGFDDKAELGPFLPVKE